MSRGLKILCQRKQEISDAMWMSGVKQKYVKTKLTGTEKLIDILKYSLDQKQKRGCFSLSPKNIQINIFNRNHIKALSDTDTRTAPARAAEGNVLRFVQLLQFSPNSWGAPAQGGGLPSPPPHPPQPTLPSIILLVARSENPRPISESCRDVSVVTQRSVGEDHSP